MYLRFELSILKYVATDVKITSKARIDSFLKKNMQQHIIFLHLKAITYLIAFNKTQIENP